MYTGEPEYGKGSNGELSDKTVSIARNIRVTPVFLMLVYCILHNIHYSLSGNFYDNICNQALYVGTGIVTALHEFYSISCGS